MRTAWLLQGLGFLILLVALYFLLRENTEPQTETREIPITNNNEMPMQEKIIIQSPAFSEGSPIPSKYTCDGDDVSPPLSINNVPEGTVSLVLIMDDPDAPNGTWDHWVAFNIDPKTVTIGEGGKLQGIDGINSWNKTGYGGPCPPEGRHRYFFTVYSLDTKLGLQEGTTKEEVLEAMKGHILDEATLMGVYERTH